MSPIGNSWKIPWRLVLIFFFFTAGFWAAGYLYYERQETRLYREMEAQLKAIANLKVKQIVAWRQERMHDAFFIFGDPIFASEVQDWFEGKGPPYQKDEILHRMEALKQNLYEGIRLLDSQGRVRLAIPTGNQEVTPLIREIVKEAVANEKVNFTDLHHDPGKELKLDLVVPIHFHKLGRKIDVGVLLLNINPHQFLFPLIQSWPTLSSTAEFSLVRREGDEVVYLNELRHHKGAALALRLPLTEERDPGVKAALGKEEISPGIDYRGVRVLAATRTIPDSPWFLVAKIDISEISSPLRRESLLVSLLLIALIAASGAGIAYFWRNREVHFYRQQYETESQRRALAQRYEYLTRHANDIILIMDQDWKIIEANDRAVAAYGYRREELLSLNLWELYHEHHCSSGENGTVETVIGDGLTFETLHRRKDGAIFPVAVSSSVLEIGNEVFYQQIIRDITLSEQREKALQESEVQMRYLSSQLLKIQEEERRRISKELHDELGQALMVLKFQTEAIEAGLAKGKKEVTADFHSLLHYLDAVIDRVRRLSRDLSPAFLEELGFSAAIENLLEEFGEHIDIRWSPEKVKELDHQFSTLAEVNIYRIFQESLTNIGRHAQASQITVSIEKQDGEVAFTVEDNGRGFEVDKVRDRGSRDIGIGLAAMEERARLAGGSLNIWSQPGTGTKITFTIPLDKEENS